MKHQQKHKRHWFSMSEVVLSLVVVVIGIVGVTSLLPVGVTANKNAVQQSNAADLADQFMQYCRGQIRLDYGFLDCFPTALPTKSDANIIWSNQNILGDMNVLVHFDAVNADDEWDPQSHTSGVFRGSQVTADLTVDFKGVIRAYKTVTTYPNKGNAEQVIIKIEISWPAEVPYDQRDKAVYAMEVFKPGEMSLTMTSNTGDECVTAKTLVPGTNVEGWGKIHDLMKLETSGGVTLAYMEGMTPMVYIAPNGGNKVSMGCLNAGFAFADSRPKPIRDHDYKFTFQPGVTLNKFSIRMIDNGDYNPAHATEHEVKLVGYDADDVEVDSHALNWTSTNATMPRHQNGAPGDLYYTGDACSSAPGQPGNYDFVIEGSGIVKVQFEYTHNGNQDWANSDPNFALSDLCITFENIPDPCKTLAGEININPNNSPHNEFELTKPDGTLITRDDLHQNTVVQGGGTYYNGVATRIRVKPKGNGNQNSLVVDGQAYTLENKNTYIIESTGMAVRVYNDHIHNNGKAMGKWWIETTADCAQISVQEDNP